MFLCHFFPFCSTVWPEEWTLQFIPFLALLEQLGSSGWTSEWTVLPLRPMSGSWGQRTDHCQCNWGTSAPGACSEGTQLKPPHLLSLTLRFDLYKYTLSTKGKVLLFQSMCFSGKHAELKKKDIQSNWFNHFGGSWILYWYNESFCSCSMH